MPAPEPSFLPGEPCWVDLLVDDVDRAARFYGDVLGWRAAADSTNESAYRVTKRNGRAVAGIGRQPVADSGMTPAWTAYLAVDDPGAVTARAEAAGGEVGSEPDQDRGFGRAAVLVDPAGARFGIWQLGAHQGAELLNEPGAMCWCEAVTADFESSTSFYTAVFDYVLDRSDEGEMRFAIAHLDGRPVAGIRALGEDAPLHESSHWDVYFAVEDCDATTARVPELGGGVLLEPVATPYGRTAVVVGPEGERFGIIQLPAGA